MRDVTSQFWENTYPFQISVGSLEVVQILQAIRDVNQLHCISQLPVEIGWMTHEHRAVGVLILLNELVDVSIIHPLRNHRKPVFTHRHPK